MREPGTAGLQDPLLESLLPSLPLYAKHKPPLWECALITPCPQSGNEPDYQHFVQQPRMLVARYS